MFLVLAIFVTITITVVTATTATTAATAAVTSPDEHDRHSFLFNSSQAIKDSFNNMIEDVGNLTDAQIDRAIEVWKSNQTDIIQVKI